MIRTLPFLAVATLLACTPDVPSSDTDLPPDFPADGATPARTEDINPSGLNVVDPLAPQVVPEVPGRAGALARQLLAAPDLAAAVQTTQAILAEGGIGVGFGTEPPVSLPGANASRMTVGPNAVVALALEGRGRRSQATLTLDEFAVLVKRTSAGPHALDSSEAWVKLFKRWFDEATARPDAPGSFAILFIAAMNQAQDGAASIASGTEAPSHLRLSLLELELMMAAFDMTFLRHRNGGPPGSAACSQFFGGSLMGQGIGIAATEEVSSTLGHVLKQLFGEALAESLSTAAEALGVVNKLMRLVQAFRLSTFNLTLETANPVRKPTPSQGKVTGQLRALVQVDPQAYRDATAQGPAATAESRVLRDCLGALGLPTTTNAVDVAGMVDSWRVTWAIERGGGSQVLWDQGQVGDILSRTERRLTRASPTSAQDELRFQVLPQASEFTVGRERERLAVFRATLRRGSAPDLTTLYGSGKAGALAAVGSGLGAVLGLTNAMTDLLTSALLEYASPSAFVTQRLIEIEPAGWHGPYRVTRRSHDVSSSDAWTDGIGKSSRAETRVADEFNGELLITPDGRAQLIGSLSCTKVQAQAEVHVDGVEGSEVVGNSPEGFSARKVASVVTRAVKLDVAIADYSSLAGQPAQVLAQLPEELRARAGLIEVTPAGLGCDADDSALEASGYLSWAYDTVKRAWVSDSDYQLRTVQVPARPMLPPALVIPSTARSVVGQGSDLTGAEYAWKLEYRP